MYFKLKNFSGVKPTLNSFKSKKADLRSESFFCGQLDGSNINSAQHSVNSNLPEVVRRIFDELGELKPVILAPTILNF